jgi:hypothetical protein
VPDDLTRQRLSNQAKAKLFDKHLPLTTHLAKRFAKRHFTIPLQEIIDEAQGRLSLVVSRWNQKDGEGYNHTLCNPTSWIYRELNWHLQTYCQRKRPRENRIKTFSVLERDENPVQLPAKKNWLEGILHSLGEDARIIVGTILSAPREIAEELQPATCGRARIAVREYLVKRKGWSMDRLDMAWKEVSECLAA